MLVDVGSLLPFGVDAPVVEVRAEVAVAGVGVHWHGLAIRNAATNAGPSSAVTPRTRPRPRSRRSGLGPKGPSPTPAAGGAASPRLLGGVIGGHCSRAVTSGSSVSLHPRRGARVAPARRVGGACDTAETGRGIRWVGRCPPGPLGVAQGGSVPAETSGLGRGGHGPAVDQGGQRPPQRMALAADPDPTGPAERGLLLHLEDRAGNHPEPTEVAQRGSVAVADPYGGLHRPGQLRHQPRRGRPVRLHAGLGDRGGQPGGHQHITAVTNRVEAFHGFSDWLRDPRWAPGTGVAAGQRMRPTR